MNRNGSTRNSIGCENNFFFRFEPRNTLYQDYTVPILTYARISHKGRSTGNADTFIGDREADV